MKKILLSFISLMMLIGFAACKVEIENADNSKTEPEQTSKTDEHEHTFATEWTNDQTYHWHVATCEHTTEISEKAEHIFDEYQYNNNTTKDALGTKNPKCSVCGYVDLSTTLPATGPNSSKYKFTENVIELEEGTDGTIGTSGKYVLFGDFPRTVAASNITFNLHPEDNGYYLGSDGNYYAKITVNAHEGVKYSNKKAVVTDVETYFKVEPIKWRVLTTDYNGTGNALLCAEEILTANVPYYESNEKHRNKHYANNYEDSQIRAYLNGISYQSAVNTKKEKEKWLGKGFLQQAFTQTAQEKIAVTTVRNDGESTTDADKNNYWANGKLKDGITDSGRLDYTCNDTEDKIFLLSMQEVTTVEYGYAKYAFNGSSKTRKKAGTDFAKANYLDAPYSWLRSPSPYSDAQVQALDAGGDFTLNSALTLFYGVVPALSIKLQ